MTSRGDRREDVYHGDDDRRAWLELLGQVCERFNWTCHGWCQMTNHYHAIIETAGGNLSQGMRQLNGVYTQIINRTYRRVGHVFQGRYKAIMVEKDSYLPELARYVVLNPVRAGMVADAGQWAWSSYAAMIGKESAHADSAFACFWLTQRSPTPLLAFDHRQRMQSGNPCIQLFMRAGIRSGQHQC